METKHRIHPIILAHAREMRHPQTPVEATLWRVLRNRHTGFKFSGNTQLTDSSLTFIVRKPSY